MTAQPTLETLSSAAERLATKRRELIMAAAEMEIDVTAVRRKHLPTLRKLAIDVKALLAGLEGMVSTASALFTKPKSRTVADIQFGFRKGRGSTTFDDEAKVIARVRKFHPELADVLIVTKETISKDALGNLEADVLKKLGISIVEAGDAPFVKAKDADTDELIKIVLGEQS